MASHTVAQLIGGLVALYLIALLMIAGYLKRRHDVVWTSLGSPSLLNWSISSSFKLGGYVFLNGAHRRLDDRRLTAMIYGTRALVVLLVAVIWFWKTHYQAGA
jgi:hypothetical protein